MDEESRQRPDERPAPGPAVESFGQAGTGNWVVEGDNLEALTLLMPIYRSRVKVIYIDPPYNTGNTRYRFRDRFGGDDDRHARWLSFMRPRLAILRECLEPSGAIFVSIDDCELFRLGLLMDELFGEANRLGVVCWEKKYGVQNDARSFSMNHEYLLCYARDRESVRVRLLPRSDEMDRRYRNRDDDPRGPWKSGDFSVKTPSASYMYPITLPSGRVVTPPPGRSWCTNVQRFQELVADRRIWFGRLGDAKPQLKQFLSEVRSGKVPSSLWRHSEVGHTDQAKRELKRILDVSGADFQTPKPTALVKRCIQLLAGPDDLVLDAFAGTGTTGQAVLELNRDDPARRRFLLVESGNGDDRFCRELTVERLVRVITGDHRAGKVAGTGGGFAFVRSRDLPAALPAWGS
ncbi:MAG: site-specific DNA-methyltransferase [Candidatus Riflebacteria bacterium]|nr:site-specific DNA-methyltransferase [Candidatus Riflebacteria bacterium]